MTVYSVSLNPSYKLRFLVANELAKSKESLMANAKDACCCLEKIIIGKIAQLIV